MAEEISKDSAEAEVQDAEGQSAIEGGAYEIIRARLLAQGRELGERNDKLNAKRIEVFGGTEMSVLGQLRIRTENNCVPRDIVPLGDRLLFGYNVFLGLKREISVADVFTVQHFVQRDDDIEFEEVPLAEVDFLNDPAFVKDFNELYTYYKDSRLVQLRHLSGRLLAVFQTSDSMQDIKVLRWGVDAQGVIKYIDNHGDRDHVFPPSHDFNWVETGREDFVLGQHPHVNILDQVFVETVGGDLTVKVEDNTEDGQGIYRELVEQKDQSLDDGRILYAKLGTLILLKVLPYREDEWRYLVFNTRNQDVQRIDAIGHACVQLPEDHGIIFPGGYYLQDGESKRFDIDAEGLEFKHSQRSPNGEDVLYVFYQRSTGRHLLFSYNLIRKEVSAPIICNGFSVFDDGRLVVFRGDSEPTRVHGVALWQTPFMSEEEAEKASAASAFAGSLLVKIGNPDLVRGISDCNSLRRSIGNQSPTVQIYEDLIAATTRIIDQYYWLGEPEVGPLLDLLKQILKNAELIIDEFEKVLTIQKAAQLALQQAQEEQEKLVDDLRPDLWETVDQFVDAMARLRSQRGKLITLRDMRYIDTKRLSELDGEAKSHFDSLSEQAVQFLLRDDALKPYHDKDKSIMQRIDAMKQAREAVEIGADLDSTALQLDVLTEVIGGLEIEDPTDRTRILEEISEIFSLVNRARATLEGRRKELASHEGVAEFGAQFKLFNQSVQSALAVADSPEKCDDQLSRLMVQLEELEGRFGDFDQFLGDLAQKREEVYEALSGKKQTLVEARQRRAQNIADAAERILTGIKRRAQTFKTLEELNAYFAADTMVLKVRDLAEQLMGLGETVRADDLVGKLKSGRDGAARQLRDKTELFAEGDNIIKLGQHHFTVNTQSLDLTLLQRGEMMTLHLSGTDFFAPIEDPKLNDMREFWNQSLVSENAQVYRSEYLAACILQDAEANERGLNLTQLREKASQEEALLKLVRDYAAERYDEGYDRGVHDHDAALILSKLVGMHQSAGLLRYAPQARAAACLFWAYFSDREAKALRGRKAYSFGQLRAAFAQSPAHALFAHGLAQDIAAFCHQLAIDLPEVQAEAAGRYLAEELAANPLRFATSAEAVALLDAFYRKLDHDNQRAAFDEDQRQLEADLSNRYLLAQAWLQAFVDNSDDDKIAALSPVLDEAVVLLISEGRIDRDTSGAMSSVVIEGLLGQHPRLNERRLNLRLDEFLTRVGQFRHITVPAFHAFRSHRSALLEQARSDLRLDEFQPRVLSSFVRNRLINEAYLPLIGDNLAKQIGAAGSKKRTDLMGLLLLISPPGYGKTTLMEYVANRLGLIFMKINGPSLGFDVTSFDPDEAPNATARQEVNKINLAFEMGNNVMLYVDDIQHTNPEFLQKFISLTDASRRVEGVWKGRTQTYDLRGKKFCVVMAGNPYTESGDKFQIPDMLANRADIYNLGDILGGKEEVFALSYIENALTSNAVLQPLATRELKDLYLLVRMSRGEEIPASELSYNYSGVEVQELQEVLRKLFRVQEVVLAVNAAYIASAATDDKFRTEPRFQLQGSYRNMNKMAEKVVSVMNDVELEQLIDDHYQGEAQTLTSGAEANLLKLAELREKMTEVQRARWDEIRKTFGRNQMLGDDDDPVARVTATLGNIGQQLNNLTELISEVSQSSQQSAQDRSAAQAQALTQRLDALVQSIAQASAQAQQAGGKQGEALREMIAQLSTQVSQDLSQGLAHSGQQLKKTLGALNQAQQTSLKQELAFEQQHAERLQQGLTELSQSLQGLARSGQAQQGAQVQSLTTGLAALQSALSETLSQTQSHQDKRLGAATSQLSKVIAGSMSALAQNQQSGKQALHTQLLDELGQLRQTLVWVGQNTGHVATKRGHQLDKSLNAVTEQLVGAIGQSSQAQLRVQGQLANGNQIAQQGLGRSLQQLAALQSQSPAQSPAGPHPSGGDEAQALVQMLRQQAGLIEGSLMPMVKSISQEKPAAGGTAAPQVEVKLDQALALLKEIEEKAEKGAFGHRYVPVGTRRGNS